MNSTDELERLRSSARIVNRIAWGVVAGIMVYGVPIVYGYLTTHDIPKQTAWMLSLIVDAALAVAMVATPLLAQYGVKAGWVGSLRFIAGFATWALNTAGSWTKPDGPDLAGVASHTWGPVLMFFAVEAAAQFQRKIAEVIRQQEGTARAEADEVTRLRTEAATATRKLAEVEAAFRAEQQQRAGAEEAHRAEETARQEAERQAEADRQTYDADRQKWAEQQAATDRQNREQVTLLKAQHAEAAARFRQQLDEVQASARDARAQAAEASDEASSLAGQLTELRGLAERAIAEKVTAEGRAAALVKAHEAVSAELARVNQAHDRLARKVGESAGGRRPAVAGAATRQTGRAGSGIAGSANRKALPAVPDLLPEGVPADTPAVPSVKPETVARVLAAYRMEPGATRVRTAEIAGVSAKTVQNVLTAVPANLLALPVGDITTDDRAAV